jgi:hypothetical protein
MSGLHRDHYSRIHGEEENTYRCWSSECFLFFRLSTITVPADTHLWLVAAIGQQPAMNARFQAECGVTAVGVLVIFSGLRCPYQ